MSVTAFSSKEEIVDHLKDQYIKEGVVLTTKRSKEVVLWLKCDRGAPTGTGIICQMKHGNVRLAVDLQAAHSRSLAG